MATDFGFYDEKFQTCARRTYRAMRGTCPVRHNTGVGWYGVFRHADIMKIARGTEMFPVRYGPGTNYADKDSVPVLVGADPPWFA